MEKSLLWELFYTFAKIGLFTFGGGYAMIALIEDQCVEKKGWITSDDLATVTAIAESTPGPIAINCATYTGYQQAGFAGATAATIGIVLPSFLIIYAISLYFNQFLEISLIANAFRGIKIAVGVVIFQAAIKMVKKMKKQSQPLFIFTAAFLTMLAIDLFAIRFSTIYLLLIAGLGSVAAFQFKGGTNGKEVSR